jgi:hypothetical protein
MSEWKNGKIHRDKGRIGGKILYDVVAWRKQDGIRVYETIWSTKEE